ncbi:MAG: phosphatase PAP2 family protein [Acidimicrobiales bacterium]|jgi:undecaprenyl-diphosphatase
MNSLIIFVGKYFFLLSLVLVGAYWLRATKPVKIDLIARLVVGGALAAALAVVAGHLHYDTRPFVTHHLVPLIPHAADNGFPSDHALLTAFLGFTMLLYSRALAAVLLGIAVLVGAARVAAHIHNPQDIVASFVIAALSVVIVEVVFRLWNRRRQRGARERGAATAS